MALKNNLEEIKNVETFSIRYEKKKELSNAIIKPSKSLLFFSILALISLFILNKNTTETEIYLNNLQKDIIKINQNNDFLSIELEKEKSLEKVEKIAKESLNMRQITNSEITYLNVLEDNNTKFIINDYLNDYRNKEISVPIGY